MKNSSSLLFSVMVLVCGLALSACDKGGGGSQPAVGTTQIAGINGSTSTLPYVMVTDSFDSQMFAYAYPYIAGAVSPANSCELAVQRNIAPIARVQVGSADNFSGRRQQMRRLRSFRWQRYNGMQNNAGQYQQNQTQNYATGIIPAGQYVFCFYANDRYSSVRNQSFSSFYGAVNFSMPVTPGNEYMLISFNEGGQWMTPVFGTRSYFETRYRY